MGYRPGGGKKSQAPLEEPGFLEKSMDYLSRPSRAIAGGVRGAFDDKPETTALGNVWENITGKRKDDWDQTLGDVNLPLVGKMEEGPLRTGVGLGLDLVADPLNLVGTGLITKGIKALPGAVKASEALRGVGTAIGKTKVARGAKNLVRETVSPTFMMDEPIARLGRLTASQQRSAPERVIAELAEGKIPEMPAYAKLDIKAQKRIGTTPEAIAAYEKKVAADKFMKDFFKDAKAGRAKKFEELDPELAKDLENTLKHTIGGRRTTEREKIILDFLEAPENRKYLRDATTRQSGDVTIRGLDNASPELIHRLTGGDVAKDVYIPGDLAKALQVEKMNPQKEADFSRSFDKWMDKWRSGATKYNPRFHVTNAIGNVYNMAASGVNPLKAYKEGRAGRMAELASRDINGISGAEVADAIKRFDIDKGLGQHLSYSPGNPEETIKSIEEFTKPKGFLSKKADQIGDVVERTARRGTVVADIQKNTKKGFLTGKSNLDNMVEEYLKQGLSKNEALKAAKKEVIEKGIIKSKDALFDYRELTGPQRTIRRYVAPFATFGFKNTRLQAQSLKDNPKVPAAVAKIFNTIQREADERGAVSKDYVPDWLKDTLSPQLPQDLVDAASNIPGLGNLKGKPTFLRNVLPTSDLNNLGAIPFTDPSAIPKLLKRDASGIVNEDALNNMNNYLGPLPTAVQELILTRKYKGTTRQTMDKRGLGTPTVASPAIQTLNSLISKTGYNPAKEMGILYKNKYDPDLTQVEIPVGLNYPVSMIPLATSVGKAMQSVVDAENVRDPLALASWLGIPITAQNEKMLRATFGSRMNERKRQSGMERSQEKRRVR